ncbi:MAG: nucleotidyltransferase family protein [Phaeodactylibacter sp.]|uniref:nucleotidyltransferase family protein n=1 Tax=Phaeodactylibacter sp. TaxID=1940289 RepID=UPI0032EF1235
MKGLEDYYRLIASVLSPDEETIDPFHASVDWERFIFISSSHLVLPAIYCQILRKGWSHYFPEDLLAYLEAVTAENRLRNQEILVQMKELGALFDAKGIEYVFLKGGAMLAGGYYEDIGERMMGDIDLLVNIEDSISTFKLLEELGYRELFVGFFHPSLTESLEQTHLPRISHPDKIAAVEIHNRLRACLELVSIANQRFMNLTSSLNFHLAR